MKKRSHLGHGRGSVVAIGALSALCSLAATAAADEETFECTEPGAEGYVHLGICGLPPVFAFQSGPNAVAFQANGIDDIGDNNFTPTAIVATSVKNGSNGTATAVRADAWELGDETASITGVSAIAGGGVTNTGVTTVGREGTNAYGVNSIARDATNSYGVYANAFGTSGSKNYGIYAKASGGTAVGMVADINSTINNAQVILHEQGDDFARLQFDNTAVTSFFQIAGKPAATSANASLNIYYNSFGNVAQFRGDGAVRFGALPVYSSNTLCSDTTSGGGWIGRCSSSRRYKKDIEDLGLGMAVVSRLRPVSFTSTTTGARDFGFIAEEVAQIDPLLATHDDKGRPESVRYLQMSAVLANAVQTQQKQITKLQEDATRRETAVADLGALVGDQKRMLERQAALIERLETALTTAGAAARTAR